MSASSIDTPTWRASLDWGARLGYDPIRLAAINRRAVEFVTALADERPGLQRVVNGVIGPRGDGYVVGATMSASEAAAYHGLQARAFAEAGAEMISAITMTYAEEAIGIARAAGSVSLPVVISLTVETDGRMPSGQTLGDAIAQIDAATTTLAGVLHGELRPPHPLHRPTRPDSRLGRTHPGVRANASTMSHAELDAATELDRGDIGLPRRQLRPAGVGARPPSGRRVLRHRPRTRPHRVRPPRRQPSRIARTHHMSGPSVRFTRRCEVGVDRESGSVPASIVDDRVMSALFSTRGGGRVRAVARTTLAH